MRKYEHGEPHRLRAERASARRDRRAAGRCATTTSPTGRAISSRGIVDFVPNDRWTFSVSGGVGNGPTIPTATSGCSRRRSGPVSFAVDYRTRPTASALGRHLQLRTLRRPPAVAIGEPESGQTDPKSRLDGGLARDRELLFTLCGAAADWSNTEARAVLRLQLRGGQLSSYTVVPGGPLPAPSQLPRMSSASFSGCTSTSRHRLSNQLAGTLSYYFEPFRVYRLCRLRSRPSVNSIDQPSSLRARDMSTVPTPCTPRCWASGISGNSHVTVLGGFMLNRRTSTNDVFSRRLLDARLSQMATAARRWPDRMRRRCKRAGGLHRRRSASCVTPIAGKGNKTNPLDGVGAKLSAADIKAVDPAPDRDDGKAKSHQEAADARPNTPLCRRQTWTRSSPTCRASNNRPLPMRREAPLLTRSPSAACMVATASAAVFIAC